MTHCLVIGEVGLAHDGSLGIAHAFVDAIADAGADAVKFQTHIASAESTPAEPFRVAFSRQDASRFDYWMRTAFSADGWAGLASHAADRGLLFIISPFSVEAINLLEGCNVDRWKIASGEVTTPDLLERTLSTGKPVMVSSGLSTRAELDEVVETVRKAGNELTLMQCTSEYPCPPERVGLNVLADWRARYCCAVGLSDHSGTEFPGIAAATVGANAVEVHVTFSPAFFGPDVTASLTLNQLERLVRGVRFIEKMLANPVDKDRLAEELKPTRRLFTKSVVARTDLVRGTVIERHHLAAKKPGTGIPASRIDDVVGARLLRDVAADELLDEDDLEIED